MRFVLFVLVVLCVFVVGCAGEEEPLLCEPSGSYVATMGPATTTCTTDEQQMRFSSSRNCISANTHPTACVHVSRSECEADMGQVTWEIALAYADDGESAEGTFVRALVADDLDPCEITQDITYTRPGDRM